MSTGWSRSPDRTVLSGFPDAKLDQILQESHSEPIAATLALLQLGNFYEIRHWVGKSEANLLLSDIARLLKKSLPDAVTLCRCHHYEFAALLLNECSINARPITDRAKQALHSAVSSVIPPQLELKCAIGLAVLEPTIPSAEVLFARARHQLSYF
ncbi:MAG: diguanylate cyclase, partial [Gammaproteobacteria bacterium]|nr:diguanylate cyclase [Gammaproteobacteria bacterium]